VLPVIIAALGFAVMQTKTKWLMAGGIMGSFLLLFFIADLYLARAGFLLFPIVYPAAVVGIDTAAGFLKRRLQLSESIFRFAAYAVILLLSNVNVSRLVYYD